MLKGFSSIIIILSFYSIALGVSYIQSPPLVDIIKTPVKDVSDSEYVKIPIITWGGDIATIYANGNSKQTQKGSIFEQLGIKVELYREDNFQKQLEDYLNGTTPFLRGTHGMIMMAIEKISQDERTKPIDIYQLTWSSGGDALVVKENIDKPLDLKGKTISLQAYGPHVDYMAKVLTDAGLTINDVTIKWTKDLTGTENTPAKALKEGVDAVFVISPDALALTSGGKIGTGSEDSVKGAKILMSTKTANKIIADHYIVRADFFNKKREWVEKFVHGLLIAEEELGELIKNKSKKEASYQKMITSSAEILMDSNQAIAEVEGLYGDCEYLGFEGNVKVFTDKNYPRNREILTNEIQTSFISLGLMKKRVPFESANWDWNNFKKGLKDIKEVEAPKFDQKKVEALMTKKQAQGTLASGEIFSFEIHFKPNQSSFDATLYKDQFDKAINLISTYGGAILTIEGHSDPLPYLKLKKENKPQLIINQTRQAAKNLSYTRAANVRDNLISYAKNKGIILDPSQFATIGVGIDQPKNGTCDGEPCPPKTEQEWLDNMRVVFRIIQIEAESSEFKPL